VFVDELTTLAAGCFKSADLGTIAGLKHQTVRGSDVAFISTGVLSDDGRVLSPVGPPTSVIFRALGTATSR
jgi:hypothetical protein